LAQPTYAGEVHPAKGEITHFLNPKNSRLFGAFGIFSSHNAVNGASAHDLQFWIAAALQQ
jgi:hypothetical protein